MILKNYDCDDLRNAEDWIQQQCSLCLLLLFTPVSKLTDFKEADSSLNLQLLLML